MASFAVVGPVPRVRSLCSVGILVALRVHIVLHCAYRRTRAHRFCSTYSVVFASLFSVLRFVRRFRMVAVCSSFLHSADRHFRRRRYLRWSAFYLHCWRPSYHASSAVVSLVGLSFDVWLSVLTSRFACSTFMHREALRCAWRRSLRRPSYARRFLRRSSRAHRFCTTKVVVLVAVVAHVGPTVCPAL